MDSELSIILKNFLIHVKLLFHNFNIRTILHFILSVLQNQSSC